MRRNSSVIAVRQCGNDVTLLNDSKLLTSIVLPKRPRCLCVLKCWRAYASMLVVSELWRRVWCRVGDDRWWCVFRDGFDVCTECCVTTSQARKNSKYTPCKLLWQLKTCKTINRNVYHNNITNTTSISAEQNEINNNLISSRRQKMDVLFITSKRNSLPRNPNIVLQYKGGLLSHELSDF